MREEEQEAEREEQGERDGDDGEGARTGEEGGREKGEGRLNEVVQLVGETPRQTSDLSAPSSAASLTLSLRRQRQPGTRPKTRGS